MQWPDRSGERLNRADPQTGADEASRTGRVTKVSVAWCTIALVRWRNAQARRRPRWAHSCWSSCRTTSIGTRGALPLLVSGCHRGRSQRTRHLLWFLKRRLLPGFVENVEGQGRVCHAMCADIACVALLTADQVMDKLPPATGRTRVCRIRQGGSSHLSGRLADEGVLECVVCYSFHDCCCKGQTKLFDCTPHERP